MFGGKKSKVKLRSVGAKAAAKRASAGEILQLPPHLLKMLGRTIMKHIAIEYAKDLIKSQSLSSTGGPVGMPNSDDFLKSFTVSVANGQVEISSSWPLADQHISGRPPYKMTWLTREAGVTHVPFSREGGQVVIRTTPLRKEDAWIHPGFRKFNFFERGVRKGREEAIAKIAEYFVQQALAG